MTSVDKDVEKLELSHAPDGNIKLSDHFGKQFGSFWKVIYTYIHIVFDSSITQVFVQKKQKHT